MGSISNDTYFFNIQLQLIVVEAWGDRNHGGLNNSIGELSLCLFDCNKVLVVIWIDHIGIADFDWTWSMIKLSHPLSTTEKRFIRNSPLTELHVSCKQQSKSWALANQMSAVFGMLSGGATGRRMIVSTDFEWAPGFRQSSIKSRTNRRYTKLLERTDGCMKSCTCWILYRARSVQHVWGNRMLVRWRVVSSLGRQTWRTWYYWQRAWAGGLRKSIGWVA